MNNERKTEYKQANTTWISMIMTVYNGVSETQGRLPVRLEHFSVKMTARCATLLTWGIEHHQKGFVFLLQKPS